MKIIHTSKFLREYKKLPREMRFFAEEREKIFRGDPFDPRLNTHKLHGRFHDFWSFTIAHHYRIIFEFGNNGIVYFHSVGDHSVYQ